jgi:tetratricopeptide (TPR) repeat protein
MSLLIAFALAASGPAPAIEVKLENGVVGQTTEAQRPNAIKIDKAWELISSGRRDEAVALLDEVIASEEALHQDGSRQYYSSRSMVETIMYSGIAATLKKNAVILDETWAYAYFSKGFVLIDLGRSDEAEPYFNKAIALAPMNSQMLAERGEWHKSRKVWDKAFADFESAASAAEFSPDERTKSDKARALRGMGFVRIEQGEVKEAEKLFHQSLKLEPGNSNALNELEYIKSLKSK